MKSLEQIAKEFQNSVINTQLKILQSCAMGENGYRFIEDNSPPVYRTTRIDPINGDPFSPYSELAPHWEPPVRKLARWMLKKLNCKEINLPLQKDRPLQRSIFVLDRSGMIDVEIYVSDDGINCKYKSYTILDTLVPFLHGVKKLEQIEPFYTYKGRQ